MPQDPNVTDNVLPFPADHCIEWSRVDCISDVQRFADPDEMRERFRDLVENDPEAIFVVAVEGHRPVELFRRDQDASLKLLSPERQKRALYLCAGAQARHNQRWGDLARTHVTPWYMASELQNT